MRRALSTVPGLTSQLSDRHLRTLSKNVVSETWVKGSTGNRRVWGAPAGPHSAFSAVPDVWQLWACVLETDAGASPPRAPVRVTHEHGRVSPSGCWFGGLGWGFLCISR